MIDIGIAARDREALAERLGRLLADTYTLYVKTQSFHWNVSGPLFQSLHLMFEQQYQELASAVDRIAERIRVLGHPAPGSLRAFLRLSSVVDADEVAPSANEMIRSLIEGHETVIRTARSILPIAFDVDDVTSAEMVTTRLAAHEKTSWMLRSLLET